MSKKLKKPEPDHPHEAYRCCCDYRCVHVAEYPTDLFFFFLQHCCLLCCRDIDGCTVLVLFVRSLFALIISFANFYYAVYVMRASNDLWTILIISFVVVFIGLLALSGYARACIVQAEDYRCRHKFNLVFKFLELLLAAGTVAVLVLSHRGYDEYSVLQWVVAGIDCVLDPIEICVTIVVLKNLSRVRNLTPQDDKY